MTNPVDAFVASGGTSGASTAQNSRYYGLASTTWTAPDGTVVRYLQRRIIPQPEQFAVLRQYVTIEGDRIDNIANAQLGDPLLYWLICDANAASDPDALTQEPGTVLRITLPAGIGAASPGGPGANHSG